MSVRNSFMKRFFYSKDWFKKYEGIFRNQQLQNAFKEKKDKLAEYIADRNAVKDYEKTIDDFVNHSHLRGQTVSDSGEIITTHPAPTITQ